MKINLNSELLQHLIFTCYFKEHLSKQYEREHHLVSYHGRFFYTLFIAVAVKDNAYFLLQSGLQIFTNFEKMFSLLQLCGYNYKHFNERILSVRKSMLLVACLDCTYRCLTWFCSSLDDHFHIFFRPVLGFRMRILLITH